MSSFSQLQEDYALRPASRPELIKSVTPGTEEYYLYRLRYLSQQFQSAEVPVTAQAIDEALALVSSAEKSNVITDVEQFEQLKTQIMLLAFPVKPDLLLKHLHYDPGMLNVSQGNKRPEDGDSNTSDGVENLPTTLDQNLFKTEVLTEKLMKDIENNINDPKILRDLWPHLLAQPKMEAILDQLDDDHLNSLFNSMDIMYSPKSLEVIGKADTSRIDQVVVKVILRLFQRGFLDFSSCPRSFSWLTWAQLESMKKEMPQVANDEGFVGLLEKRIAPEAFPEQEDIAYQNWLDRMLVFVDELPPKFNRYKLSVYLISLENDLIKGVANKAKFLRYVAIPRDNSYYNQATLKSFDRQVLVDLNLGGSLAHWSDRVCPVTEERDERVLKEYLSQFMCEAKSSTEFEPYLETKTFLNPLLARAMLMAGDKDIAKWAGLLPKHDDLASLTEQTILKFAPNNPAKFMPWDDVVFKLRAKNAKRILVRVFEIKTFEYQQQYEDTVMGQSLNLDGLTPNWEHNLVLDHPSLEMHDITVELPELANLRGAFVMDVISNGENSSAYFTKGCLDYIERQSVAGHVITIIDEKQEKISKKCSVWLNGYYYKPHGNGDIIIPYRKVGSHGSRHIYLIHDGFAIRRDFSHRQEEYTFKVGCHVDHESLIAGTMAKVLIKPTVQVGESVLCPVSLLEQVHLTVALADTTKISSVTTVSDFKVHDIDWSEYDFQVPEGLSNLVITLSAKIKVIATGEYQDLMGHHSLEFKSPLPDQNVHFEHKGLWSSAQIPGEIVTLLRKADDGYKILVLGKNGEIRPNIPLEIEVEHPIWKQRLNTYLRSDERGEMHLGPLLDIDRLTCATTNMSWQLSGREKHVYPKYIHAIEGEPVSVALGQPSVHTIRKIALFSYTCEFGSRSSDYAHFLDDHTGNLRLQNGLLSVKGLKAGYYILRIGEVEPCIIVIAGAKGSKSRVQGLEDFILGSNPMLELSEGAKGPLHVAHMNADATNECINIQLDNWTPESRVCVFASQFQPFEGSMFADLNALDAEVPWIKEKTELTTTMFKTGRVLGDEYQYILNRKVHSIHWAGNLLTKPSFLLSPWSIGETKMTKAPTPRASYDDECKVYSTSARDSAAWPSFFRSARASNRHISSYARAPPLLKFLAHPSIVLANLIPDPTNGLVSIPYSSLKESTYLQIIITDGRQMIRKSFVTPRASDGFEFEKRDLRFKSQLNYSKHYIGERRGIDLDPRLHAISSSSSSSSSDAASITLASNGSSPSDVRIINSVSQVYDLMLTLLESEDQKKSLSKFAFIVDWNRLSDENKKDRYSKWNCHELNLFLYKKDREFFDTTIAPFLKNKVMKSFMDDFLVGAPLEKYAAIHEFNLLTCMEKCLLAKRIPELRSVVVRWIKERSHNARAASDVKLFQTVMNSGSLANTSTECSILETVEDMNYELCQDFEMDEPTPQSPAYSPSSPQGTIQPLQIIARTAPFSGDTVSQARHRSAKKLQRQFKQVDLTKEMAETYYYGRQDFQSCNGEDTNLFWLDFAQWSEPIGGSFLSQNFVTNAGSFTDAMATIALLDVTFQPKAVSLTRSATQSLVVSSQSPAIVFHSSTKELPEPSMAGSVLVTQQYFEQLEKTMYDETINTDVRKYINPISEFRPMESYGVHVVLMNATPNPMRVHLEVQIPQGSISIYESLESGQDIRLDPHGTFQYEYGFYFPDQGDFPHYPAHVSNYEDIIAYAAPSVLRVRAPLPNRKEIDMSNWSYILKYGTRDDILSKLESSPFSSLPVDLVLPRLYKDQILLQQVTELLRSRREYSEQIWAISLVTQNQDLVKEYLMSKPKSALDVGDWFTSNVYVRRPRSRLESSQNNSFRYLEYFPLINSRAHKATRNATILNDKFKDQYSRFLRLLSQKAQHDVDDLLVLTVYMLAQDRISEAKETFRQLSVQMNNPDQQSSREFLQRLQYDYLWAYLSLCVEVQIDTKASDLALDLAGVQAIVDKYRDYPVERWSKMFKDMQQYVDEIQQSLVKAEPVATGSPVAESASGSEADEEDIEEGPEVPVMVDFKVGDKNVVMVRYRGVKEVTVEYYSIDAETMFSASPFTFSDQGENESSSSSIASSGHGSANSSNGYRMVKPNGVDSHVVKRAVTSDGILMIPVLPQYLNTNVMISVSTSPPAANRTWKAYYSQTILVQCVEQTGTIRVITKSDGERPIRGGYVKIYAEMKQGSTVFWKDGYTDLVGRFAYAQVSTGVKVNSDTGGGLGDVKRFAAFVDGGREGCVVKTLPVPPV
ncbi:hypothetical protein BGZ51_006867 [Haplosporangium sp. Z 767]|nr:hypothetical protein BGZ51_006867 [Haplosporangium sp. Z 767]KAF9179548.1 hypothetical protein BGZ50_006858 [Haplosporangium sp. Z 11]